MSPPSRESIARGFAGGHAGLPASPKRHKDHSEREREDRSIRSGPMRPPGNPHHCISPPFFDQALEPTPPPKSGAAVQRRASDNRGSSEQHYRARLGRVSRRAGASSECVQAHPIPALRGGLVRLTEQFGDHLGALRTADARLNHRGPPRGTRFGRRACPGLSARRARRAGAASRGRARRLVGRPAW
jgi:hypothetical protein